MFNGDEIKVETFEVKQQIVAKRVRLVADVNGVTCFVKTFGDPIIQCAVDELKRLVGLTPLGVSRATLPTYGHVLIARYLPNHTRFNDLAPTPDLAKALLPLLYFDVWIRNNDRTGTNVLLVKDEGVIGIDESAAFKKSSTFRMTKKGPWYDAVSAIWNDWTPPALPDQSAVVETLKRTWPACWPNQAWGLMNQAKAMEQCWWHFKVDAQQRVYGGK